jgi:hypothetical protein
LRDWRDESYPLSLGGGVTVGYPILNFVPFELGVEPILLLLKEVEGVHRGAHRAKQTLLGAVADGKIVGVPRIVWGVSGREVTIFSRGMRGCQGNSVFPKRWKGVIVATNVRY